MALALLAGCERCGSDGNRSPGVPASPPARVEKDEPPEPEPSPNGARKVASALLETWKAAQNEGDSATYFAQYEPKEFKGLKRTHRGKVAKYDFAGWHKDRSGMFASSFEVAVDNPEIETWLDPKSTLKPGLISVRFMQRWRSKSYADHGPKTLLLWRHPLSRETRIVFEELLLSRPGWDEQSAAEDLSYPALAQAATVEEMTAALRAIEVDVHQAGGVFAELDDPFHRGLLLQAAVALGPLDCLEKITYTECGQDSEDWGLVEGAKLDHPCVRRALVIPLLESELLPPVDRLPLLT